MRHPTQGQDPRGGAAANRLLTVLPRDELAWLTPHLERVTVEAHQTLAKPLERLSHVYFPETCVASLLNRMSNGAAVEVGTVGHEGMVGIAEFLGGEPSGSETLVQIPGVALRLPSAALREGAETLPELRRLLGRYTQAYLIQVAQGAACNRLHNVEARCAKWLLMTHDRVGSDSFPLKQEFLALMLGVRRAGVTVAAGALQESGLIRYRRGGIRVLDRAGLEEASCECYRIVRRHFDQLLA